MDPNPEPDFKRGGTVHRVLTVLSAGPLSMGRLKEQVAATDSEVKGPNQRRRRKVWFAVQDLCRDGYVSPVGTCYAVTDKGLVELDLLGPLVVRTPHVRVFEIGGAA